MGVSLLGAFPPGPVARAASTICPPLPLPSSNTTVITEEPEETQPIPDPIPESPSAYVAFYADNQSDTDEEDTNHLRVVNYILAKGTNR